MNETKHYDAIVVGSGQAGTPLSKFLANKGKKTLLIEKRWVGGTCVNDGCSPTKAMVASARVAWLARESHSMGVHTGPVSVDIKAVIERQQKIVLSMRAGSESGIEDTENLTLVYGSARFAGHKAIEIHTEDGLRLVTGDQIFLNTGLQPAIPDIPGLDSIPYLTSTSLLLLKELPKKLLVLGAGYIGLEFAQMYRRFGSQVTVLERKERIMGREDADVSKEMTSILLEEGVEIRCNSSLKSVSRSGDTYLAKILQNGSESSLEFTHLLVAVGREPQLAPLSLDKTGVELNEKGFIKVDDFLETSAKGVYALGDVKGGPAFTHVSYDDFRLVTETLFEGNKRRHQERILPYCMFTDPQLGRVGITEQDAIKSKLNYRTATLPNTSVARAVETGDTRGLMKVVVDSDTDLILGASVIGTEGGEVISVIQMAMLGGLPWSILSRAMIAHPTYAESLNNLFSKLE